MKQRLDLQPSSAITGATYDDDSEQLEITFASGQTYTFDQVPANVAEQFASAGSPGQFYHSHIKGRY